MKKYKIILTKEVELSCEAHNEISAQSKAQDLVKMFGYDTYTVIESEKVEVHPIFNDIFKSISKAV